jgi:hypothetical protein
MPPPFSLKLCQPTRYDTARAPPGRRPRPQAVGEPRLATRRCTLTVGRGTRAWNTRMTSPSTGKIRLNASRRSTERRVPADSARRGLVSFTSLERRVASQQKVGPIPRARRLHVTGRRPRETVVPKPKIHSEFRPRHRFTTYMRRCSTIDCRPSRAPWRSSPGGRDFAERAAGRRLGPAPSRRFLFFSCSTVRLPPPAAPNEGPVLVHRGPIGLT